jgi:hypothetical protein
MKNFICPFCSLPLESNLLGKYVSCPKCFGSYSFVQPAEQVEELNDKDETIIELEQTYKSEKSRAEKLVKENNELKRGIALTDSMLVKLATALDFYADPLTYEYVGFCASGKSGLHDDLDFNHGNGKFSHPMAGKKARKALKILDDMLFNGILPATFAEMQEKLAQMENLKEELKLSKENIEALRWSCNYWEDSFNKANDEISKLQKQKLADDEAIQNLGLTLANDTLAQNSEEDRIKNQYFMVVVTKMGSVLREWFSEARKNNTQMGLSDTWSPDSLWGRTDDLLKVIPLDNESFENILTEMVSARLNYWNLENKLKLAETENAKMKAIIQEMSNKMNAVCI